MNSLPESSTRDEDRQMESSSRLPTLNPPNPIPNPEHLDAPASPAPSLRERFSNPSTALPHLQKQAQFYFSSYPGADNEAPNTTAHTMLRALLAGQVTSESSLAGIEELLTFRLSLCAMATALLVAANIPLPKGRRRCEFDLDKFEDKCDEHPGSRVARNYHHAMGLIFRNVLPDPVVGTNQGRRWNKPHHYLAAGVACDPATKNDGDVEAAVKKLEQAYKEGFDGVKRNLDRELDI